MMEMYSPSHATSDQSDEDLDSSSFKVRSLHDDRDEIDYYPDEGNERGSQSLLRSQFSDADDIDIDGEAMDEGTAQSHKNKVDLREKISSKKKGSRKYSEKRSRSRSRGRRHRSRSRSHSKKRSSQKSKSSRSHKRRSYSRDRSRSRSRDHRSSRTEHRKTSHYKDENLDIQIRIKNEKRSGSKVETSKSRSDSKSKKDGAEMSTASATDDYNVKLVAFKKSLEKKFGVSVNSIVQDILSTKSANEIKDMLKVDIEQAVNPQGQSHVDVIASTASTSANYDDDLDGDEFVITQEDRVSEISVSKDQKEQCMHCGTLFYVSSPPGNCRKCKKPRDEASLIHLNSNSSYGNVPYNHPTASFLPPVPQVPMPPTMYQTPPAGPFYGLPAPYNYGSYPPHFQNPQAQPYQYQYTPVPQNPYSADNSTNSGLAVKSRFSDLSENPQFINAQKPKPKIVCGHTLMPPSHTGNQTAANQPTDNSNLTQSKGIPPPSIPTSQLSNKVAFVQKGSLNTSKPSGATSSLATSSTSSSSKPTVATNISSQREPTKVTKTLKAQTAVTTITALKKEKSVSEAVVSNSAPGPLKANLDSRPDPQSFDYVEPLAPVSSKPDFQKLPSVAKPSKPTICYPITSTAAATAPPASTPTSSTATPKPNSIAPKPSIPTSRSSITVPKPNTTASKPSSTTSRTVNTAPKTSNIPPKASAVPSKAITIPPKPNLPNPSDIMKTLSKPNPYNQFF